MKRIGFFILFSILTLQAFSQTTAKTYKTSSGKISFFSSTPVEDIDATSNQMSSIIDPVKKQIACVVPITSFKFKNALMQEHFNENYLESDKYPKATFSGTINENIDLNTAGTYAVTVTGKLVIHGVEQSRTIAGTITVDASHKLTLKSEFNVKLVDHTIKVPEIVFNKIAETIVVKINAEYLLQ